MHAQAGKDQLDFLTPGAATTHSADPRHRRRHCSLVDPASWMQSTSVLLLMEAVRLPEEAASSSCAYQLPRQLVPGS